MKCPNCEGRGYMSQGPHFCPKCDGKGVLSMTQDAQKFTEEDLKKVETIVCDEDGNLKGAFEFCWTKECYVQMSEILAQALRDERKGLEDEIKAIRNAPVQFRDERIKALEAENEKLQSELKAETGRNKAWFKNFDDLVKEHRELLENQARLKAEVESEQRLRQSITEQRIRLCNKNSELESRLAEAVSTLEIIESECDCDCDVERGSFCVKHEAKNCLERFLSSPTNSEAQERQRAKDKVVEVARKYFTPRVCCHWTSNSEELAKEKSQCACSLIASIKALDSLLPEKVVGLEMAMDAVIQVARKIDNYKTATTHKEWDELKDALKALDSLPSEARVIQKECEHRVTGGWVNMKDGRQNYDIKDYPDCPLCKAEARGGCEHDGDECWFFHKPSGLAEIRSKSEYPTCPFCDKKTGGV